MSIWGAVQNYSICLNPLSPQKQVQEVTSLHFHRMNGLQRGEVRSLRTEPVSRACSPTLPSQRNSVYADAARLTFQGCRTGAEEGKDRTSPALETLRTIFFSRVEDRIQGLHTELHPHIPRPFYFEIGSF